MTVAMADINRVILVGRLTRDAEQSYTQSGYSILKFGLAVNRRRKQGDEWIDEANFFDVTVWGRQGEAIATYMTKGKQVGVEGQLRQERWEAQDGSKRSKVTVEASNIQLLGGRDGASSGASGAPQASYQSARWNNPQRPAEPGPSGPSEAPSDGFVDDIPF